MLSERALSKISKSKKAADSSRRHSRSCIPSEEQATERQSHLRYFHMRKLQFKRSALENQCQENYRIYFNINDQKSSYKDLFADRHSLRNRSKEKLSQHKISHQTRRQPVLCFPTEIKVGTRVDKYFKSRALQTPTQQKIGARQILTQRTNNSRADDTFNKTLAAFQSNL